ncbi:MAG: polyisoprenoid-binding protein YceI [Parasphingorhabdus sp.]|jgi:polyisoprenoid-binding protein YceI
MKKITLLILSATLLGTAHAADNYTIDPGHTYAHFAVNHLGFSTMRGRINSTGGSFTIDGSSGSVNVKLDPASVDTGHQKRDDHLRSPDFLNVVEFPEMNFEATSANLAKGGSVEGSLTLMGKTMPVSLEITALNCAEHPYSKKPTCGIDATTTIKRSDFGSQYGIPGIGDEMQLWIELEGSQ